MNGKRKIGTTVLAKCERMDTDEDLALMRGVADRLIAADERASGAESRTGTL